MNRVARLILIAAIAGYGVTAQAAGRMPSDAGGEGMTIAGIIECGQGYTSHELYDVKITLREVERGARAWQLLQAASKDNRPPQAQYDYLLARVKFEYEARGKPGDCVHTLKRSHYTALSSQGEIYPVPDVTVPDPALSGPIHSGETRDGWLAFEVKKSDAKPLMTFSVDDSGAVQHAGKLWFKLFE